ncbi:acyltransferase [Bacteroidota bacterium]
MKQFILKLLKVFFYPKYNPYGYYSIKKLLGMVYKQKILGYNRKIPWPVHFTSYIKNYKNIQTATEPVGIAMGTYIDARNGIILEENVNLGPKVSLISMNHDTNNYAEYIKQTPIIIKKNSWIGTNSIILPGVELGEHTIVGAGSVVTKSFKEGNILIAGNPAKVIKKLDNYFGH